ncbi:toll-interacting protein A-like [Styela clava]
MASAVQPQPAQAPTVNGNGGMKLTDTKRGKVLLGQLSSDFLRIKTAVSTGQSRNDATLAQQMALQQQQMLTQTAVAGTANRLNLTLVEAKLNKNYGVTRMDPYCRVIVGHAVYETATAQNGAKLPYWNKTISTTVAQDLKHIKIEIYDERAFSIDNRIAWGKIDISDAIKSGKSEDDWWPLSGKLGDEKEGMIHLQISWSKVQQPIIYNAPMPMMFPHVYNPAGVPMMMPAAAGGYMVPPGVQVGGMYPPSQPQTQIQQPAITEQDLKQVKEMFPNVEDSVIKAVLEASGGNKDAAINSLLNMQ